MRLEGWPRLVVSNPRTDNLDIQIPDLLAQRVAIDAEQVGGADLIAAGCGERCGQKRVFHLAQNAMVKAGRRQVIVKAREVARQMVFDRRRQVLFPRLLCAIGAISDTMCPLLSVI